MKKIFGMVVLFAMLIACVSAKLAPQQLEPYHPHVSHYINVTPVGALSLVVGQSATLSAAAYDQYGNLLADSSANPSNFTWQNSSIGTMGSNGTFTATAPGSDVIYVAYDNGTITAAGSKQVSVAVGAANISVQAPSPSLTVGQNMQLVAKAYAGNQAVIASSDTTPGAFVWSVDNSNASITSSGILSAVSNGSSTVTAAYNGILAIGIASLSANTAIALNAAVPAQPSNPGGSGSSNGGSAFATSVSIDAPCAGQPGSLAVSYLKNDSSNATVKIIYLGDGNYQTVFSQAAPNNAEIQFTPPNFGDYIAVVTLGTEQRNTDFHVSSCPVIPDAPGNPSNASVNVQAGTDLVFSKTVTYQNGFSRLFEVYRTVTSGNTTYYTTKVTISFKNNGTAALQNFTVTDKVPLVVAGANEITFESVPSKETSNGALRATWHVDSLAAGKTLKYTYSIGKQLASDAQFGSFGAPGMAVPPTAGNAGLVEDASGYITAAMASFSTMPALLYVAGGVVIIAMAAAGAYLFASKPAQPGQPAAPQ